MWLINVISLKRESGLTVTTCWYTLYIHWYTVWFQHYCLRAVTFWPLFSPNEYVTHMMAYLSIIINSIRTTDTVRLGRRWLPGLHWSEKIRRNRKMFFGSQSLLGQPVVGVWIHWIHVQVWRHQSTKWTSLFGSTSPVWAKVSDSSALDQQDCRGLQGSPELRDLLPFG